MESRTNSIVIIEEKIKNLEWLILNYKDYIFTEKEMEFCRRISIANKNYEVQRFASLYATKKAAAEVLNIYELKYWMIEVLHEKTGKPYLNINQCISERIKYNVKISMSNLRDCIVACATKDKSIIELGIDIIETERIKKGIEGFGELLLNKIYTKKEQEQNKNSVDYSEVFAIKEAATKALGTGLKQGVFLKDIEYDKNRSDDQLIFYNTAKEFADKLNVKKCIVESETKYIGGKQYSFGLVVFK